MYTGLICAVLTILETGSGHNNNPHSRTVVRQYKQPPEATMLTTPADDAVTECVGARV